MRSVASQTEIEDLFEILGSNLPVGVCIIQDEKFRYINPNFLIYTGYREDELLGKDFLTIVIPEDREMARENATKLLKEELASPYQFRVACKDGSSKWVMGAVRSVQYHGREAILAIYRDITERKQVEEALRESEERLQSLFETMTEGVILIAMDGQITHANLAAERILGLTRSEITERNYVAPDWKIFRPDGTPMPAEEMAGPRAMKEKRPVKDVVMGAEHPDGSIAWINVSASPITDEAGELEGVVGTFADITERKQAEEALRESEERFRYLLATSPSVIYSLRLQGETAEIAFVSENIRSILGYEPEDVRDFRFWQTLIHPDDVPSLMAQIPIMLERKEAAVLEYRIKHKDGTYRWLRDINRPIFDDKDELVEIIGAWIDITERKEAEERIRQSEEKLRLTFETVPEGITITDLNGNVARVNEAVARIHGFNSGQQLIGRSAFGFIAERDHAKAMENLKKTLEKGYSGTLEYTLVREDGSEFPGELSASLIKDASGNPDGFIAITRDITERKQAEEKLRQSEKNYRVLFDSTVIGTIVLDAETMKVLIANQAAAKIFGFSSVEEALEADPFDFILLEDKERVSELAEKALFEQNAQLTYDLRILTKDGRQRWISATGAKIVHQGRLAGLISFTDITEKKQQNEKFMLADRLASIGELAAGAAHELNNPLTSVIGFSQLLMEKDIPDDIREDLEIIYSEAQRAAGVTKNLLAFARKHRPVKQLNQINSIIEDVLKLRTYEHKIKDIEVEKQLASDLPESMVDYFQMQQVFFNIIINAEYFMTEAHDRGTLTITTENHNGTMRISFADDGPGIPLENLSQIFNPFFTTKQTGKGTGLGLSICHGVVSEHGGQIYAKSQPGEGTTIFIELPINGHRQC